MLDHSLVVDIRGAVRVLTRRPAFALLVVLTLGLGIAASTAAFSALHGLLLRDPPFADPDRLVTITSARGGEAGGAVSVPDFDDLRALPVIDDAALYTDQWMYNASGFGTPEELPGTATMHNLFRLLGVEPLLGSTFPATFDRTRNFGLVISHDLWRRRFDGDPNIVGRSMTLDGAPGYTIHGVMPAGFNFPSHAALFRSIGLTSSPAYYQRRDVRVHVVLARLASGVSVAQARTAIDDLARRLAREFPATNGGVRFHVTALRDMYSSQARPYVLLLFSGACLVLAVACANVANLLLSQATSRDREMAVRMALGAGRWRVLRACLTESALLAALGAATGALFATAGVRLLATLVPVPLPPWMQIHVDVTVMGFLMAAATLTALITGVVSATRATSTAQATALRDGARGASTSLRRQRLQSAFVAAEVALALILVIGASLLVQSLWRLHRVDLGFVPANALTFRVQLGWAVYGTADRTRAFHREVVSRLRELPNVTAVTFDDNLPMSGSPRNRVAISVEGQRIDDESRSPYVDMHTVGPDYFDVMGIGLRSGRAFDTRDHADGQPAVVVSQRLAERLWPGRDPIGQRLRLQSAAASDPWWTVVGVATPALHHAPDGAPGFDVYRPEDQQGTDGPYYVIRTSTPPVGLAPAATAIIGDIDPNQSFLDVQTYEQRVTNQMWQRRLAATLVGIFAALAMLLAVVGVYGVLTYIVGQQTRAIGVRLALGATSRDVVRDVIRMGLQPVLIGAVVGCGIAVAGGRVIAGVLYQVHPADPTTLLVAPLVLLAVAAAACYVPARAAARVDPIVALRAD